MTAARMGPIPTKETAGRDRPTLTARLLAVLGNLHARNGRACLSDSHPLLTSPASWVPADCRNKGSMVGISRLFAVRSGIALAGLDAADLGGMDAAAFGDLLLSQLKPRAGRPQLVPRLPTGGSSVLRRPPSIGDFTSCGARPWRPCACRRLRRHEGADPGPRGGRAEIDPECPRQAFFSTRTLE